MKTLIRQRSNICGMFFMYLEDDKTYSIVYRPSSQFDAIGIEHQTIISIESLDASDLLLDELKRDLITKFNTLKRIVR